MPVSLRSPIVRLCGSLARCAASAVLLMLAAAAAASASATATATESVSAPAAAASTTATATLSGTIVDEAGGALPRVAITLVLPERPLQRETVTNGDGTFTFLALPAGRYTLRAEHDRFTPAEIRDLDLRSGVQTAIRVVLRLSGIREQLAVRGSAPRLPVGGTREIVLDRQIVEQAPSNGRSVHSLIPLTPGVTPMPGGAFTAADFSVNGQRPSANYFTVDGVSANVATPIGFSLRDAQAMSGALPALTVLGTTTSLVPLDAVEEVRVQTSGYTAEHGRQPGAQIALITRAGTNRLHGSLFSARRDEALGATDWFANRAGVQSPGRQQQFGGFAGGPLRLPGYDGRDRSFFFVSHESTRVRQQGVAPDGVPSAAMAAYAARSAIDAVSLRVDQRPAPSATIFGRVHAAPSTQTWRNETDAREHGTRLRPITATVGSTWSGRRLAHDLRVNYSTHAGALRDRSTHARGIRPMSGSIVIPPGETTPRLFAVPFLSSTHAIDSPTIQFGALAHAQAQVNVVASTTIVLARHQVKAGVDYRWLRARVNPWEYGVTLSLSSVGSPGQMPSASPVPRPAATPPVEGLMVTGTPMRPQFSNLSLFVQDAWQVSPRLSLDMGLRWEVNPAPRDMAESFPYVPVTLDEGPDAPVVTPSGSQAWKTRYTNLAPRAGAAYVLGDAAGRETVLRAGGGLYYDLGGSQSGSALETVGDRELTSVWTFTEAVEEGRTTLRATPYERMPADQGFITYAVDRDLELPYTVQWHVSLDRALGATRRAGLSYVGAAGRRLLVEEIWNRLPTWRPALWVDATTNRGASDYASLQAQVQQRPWHGLQAIASYTWSRVTDVASAESRQAAAPVLVRADADFDRRHVLDALVGFAPSWRSATARLGGPPLLRALLRDWGVDGRLILYSGTPVSVVGPRVSGNMDDPPAWPVRVAGVPLYVDDPTAPGGRRVNRDAFRLPCPSGPLSGPDLPAGAGASGRPCDSGESGGPARNVARAPGAWQVDLALRRRVALAGAMRLDLRIDAYNVLNHPSFGGVDPRLDSPTFGEARTMLGQSAGRPNSPFHTGRPRSIELGLRFSF